MAGADGRVNYEANAPVELRRYCLLPIAPVKATTAHRPPRGCRNGLVSSGELVLTGGGGEQIMGLEFDQLRVG